MGRMHNMSSSWARAARISTQGSQKRECAQEQSPQLKVGDQRKTADQYAHADNNSDVLHFTIPRFLVLPFGPSFLSARSNDTKYLVMHAVGADARKLRTSLTR